MYEIDSKLSFRALNDTLLSFSVRVLAAGHLSGAKKRGAMAPLPQIKDHPQGYAFLAARV